ncbi:MAG: PIN domain-containing protein [Candidatus Dormibacteria bacterium]
MAELLVDTNRCVAHITGKRRLPERRGRLAYSVITRTELLAGDAAQEPNVRRLLAGMDEIGVDRRIADQAGLLRRELRIRTPDALIASTALVRGIALSTDNRDDFKRIPGLRISAD